MASIGSTPRRTCGALGDQSTSTCRTQPQPRWPTASGVFLPTGRMARMAFGTTCVYFPFDLADKYQRSLIMAHFMGADRVARVGAACSAMWDIGQASQRRLLWSSGRPDVPHRRPGAFVRQPRCALLVVSGTTAQRAPSWAGKIVPVKCAIISDLWY